MARRDWGLLVVLSVVWGGSFFFIEIAVREISPFTLVFLRVAIAAEETEASVGVPTTASADSGSSGGLDDLRLRLYAGSAPGLSD